MCRYAPRLMLAALAILAPSLANADMDWTSAPELTDSDKESIVEIASKLGVANPSIILKRALLPSGEKLFVVRTPVIVSGQRRLWREFSLCHKNNKYCWEQTNWGIGDWGISQEASRQERWHFSDSEWNVDVELSSAVSYAEAEIIVLAIHRNQLTSTPEVKERIFDSSKITAVRTIDPIAREFEVTINEGNSGYSLQVRLVGSDVELYGLILWRA